MRSHALQLIQSFSNPLGPKISSGNTPSVKKTVMICEDDRDLLMVYTLALRSKYNVVCTISGKECISRYSEIRKSGKKVDAVLLDYRLGDTTGDEIAMKLSHLNGTKVILISAFEIEDEVVEGLKTRGFITAFVKKPVTIGSLGATLENVLRQ